MPTEDWYDDFIDKLKIMDETAWTLLYNNYSVELMKRAKSAVYKHDLKCTFKDILHATFMVAMQKIDTFEVEDNNPSKIVHWLHSILSLEIKVEIKKLKDSQSYLSLDTEDIELEKMIWSSENQTIEEVYILNEPITQALKSLQPNEQDTIIKYYFLGTSINELAKELNLNPKSLSKKIYRLKKRIKLYLELYEQKSIKNNHTGSIVAFEG